tara:strand:+ start:6061 stop:7701 length:1641 start_codon:yes stop_codon:yes gene_type:complete
MLKKNKELKRFFRGEIATNQKILTKYSHDASLFEITPQAVVFPRNSEDIKKLVKFVSKEKNHDPSLSLTVRAAGTDMSGGPLNESIIVDVTKKLNRVGKVKNKHISAQPGVFYCDFEKVTLKQNLLLPSFPASRELCALGGMVANNAGGEKSLKYGKTIDYVTNLKVVLSDGKEYTFKPLNKKELQKKLQLKNFEGKLYKKMYRLINKNYSFIKRSKPKVSKNSSGYNLWDIWDKKTFDLTKLFVGSQGTLGIITKGTFRLIKKKKYSGLVVIFCKDLKPVVDIVHKVLPFSPSSFESFDDHSLKLALKFFPGFLKLMGAKNIFSLAWSFLPEFWLALTFGIPKLTLLVEFEEDSQEAVDKKMQILSSKLKNLNVKSKMIANPQTIKKYWLVRRESFNLLRHKVKNKQTAPFIDDFVIHPDKLRVFFPKLIKILEKHDLLYTIIGHVGDGNFHIIPLMNLADENERKKIPIVSKEVYSLVLKMKGSITGEHNDGLIRSPYLKQMYGTKMCKLFKEVKDIFDSDNLFNPGKKVNSDLEFALEHIKRS